MTILVAIGKWLGVNGWKYGISITGVTTEGRAMGLEASGLNKSPLLRFVFYNDKVNNNTRRMSIAHA